VDKTEQGWMRAMAGFGDAEDNRSLVKWLSTCVLLIATGAGVVMLFMTRNTWYILLLWVGAVAVGLGLMFASMAVGIRLYAQLIRARTRPQLLAEVDDAVVAEAAAASQSRKWCVRRRRRRARYIWLLVGCAIVGFGNDLRSYLFFLPSLLTIVVSVLVGVALVVLFVRQETRAAEANYFISHVHVRKHVGTSGGGQVGGVVGVGLAALEVAVINTTPVGGTPRPHRKRKFRYHAAPQPNKVLICPFNFWYAVQDGDSVMIVSTSDNQYLGQVQQLIRYFQRTTGTG
jgi:hypothetical protein